MHLKPVFKILYFSFSVILCGISSASAILSQTNPPTNTIEATETRFTGTITSNSVNVRSGPSINFETINKLDKNALVLVEGQEQDWYKIRIPRHSGIYIYKKYVSSVKAHGLVGLIVADRVTLRAGKGANFNSLGQLNRNDKVEILSREGEWYKVFLYDNTSACAWVNKKFVINQGSSEIYLEKEKVYFESLNLFEQAEDTEKKSFKQKNKNPDINLLVEAYNTIIDRYPDTQAAKVARKRISRLGKRLPVIKEQSPQQTTNPHSEQKLPGTEITSQVKNEAPLSKGKIMEIGRILNRVGTHKLVKENETICFLKSSKVNLNDYIYLDVAVWGKEIKTPRTKIPLIEVEEIKKLQ